MKANGSPLVLAVALAAVLQSPGPVQATNVWGRFVAHVIEIIDASTGNSVIQVVTTPSATLSLPAPASAVAYGPVTYHIQIDAPEFTPRGELGGADLPTDPAAYADFLGGPPIQMTATLSADVTMSPFLEEEAPLHWDDPAVEKAISCVTSVDGSLQHVQVAPFPRAGGSGTVGGGANYEGDLIGMRTDPFILDLPDHLSAWSSNAALRSVNRFHLGLQGRIQRQTGGAPQVIYLLEDFQLIIEPIYELTLVDPDPFPEPADGVPYLEVISWEGDAEAVRSPKYYPAFNGMKLTTRDLLSTGPESTVKLRFPDGSILVIEEMSQVALGSLIRQETALRAKLYLKLGKISAQVNPDKVANSDFSVATPVATASVRGTVLTVSYQESPEPKATVGVSEGLVEVIPGFTDPDDLDAEFVPHPSLEPFFLGGFETAEVTDETITDIELPRPRILVSTPRRFPTTRVRKSSRPQVVTISNGAGESYSLVDLAVRLGGRGARDFKVVPSAATVLAPGDSSTATITFRPRVSGTRKALLTVGGNTLTANVPLVGKGKSK